MSEQKHMLEPCPILHQIGQKEGKNDAYNNDTD